MLRALAVLVAIAGSISAQEKWVYMRSDAFQMFTNAGEKAGRTELVRLEEFRYTLGKILGNTDLAINPPAQVLLFKTAQEAAAYGTADPIQVGREHTMIVLSPGTGPTDFNYRLAKLLIESNFDRMPVDYESGLISLFSTLEVNGIRVTLGKPPGQRDRAWARMHMLTVDPENYGRVGVLFFNLQKGADEDPAFRNAFGKSKAQIEADLDRYMAAGNFGTATPSPRPLSVERDFPDQPVTDEDMKQKLAAFTREREQQAEYGKLLAKARADRADTASLDRAIELAPKQAEPRFLLAERQTEPLKRIELYKAALALDRRNANAWAALARSYLSIHDFTEAAKAWRSAEQAAVAPAEREKMQRARLDVERQRLDFEDAEKKRIADDEARELQKLKDAEIANLRALEARVNKGGAAAPGEKIVPWWQDAKPDAKVIGTLEQVDCLGKHARLHIKGSDGKIVRVIIRDPDKIVSVNSPNYSLGCGRQKSRKIVVEYFRKPDAKLTTAGDVATIEFP